MPLYQGYSRATISKNIKLLRVREGKPIKQAVAIAMSMARRSAERAGVRPAHLRMGWKRKPRRPRRVSHGGSR